MTAYQSSMPSGMPIKGTRIHLTEDGDKTLCGERILGDWYIGPETIQANCRKCKEAEK